MIYAWNITIIEEAGVIFGTRHLYVGLTCGSHCSQKKPREINVGRFAEESRGMFICENHGHAICCCVVVLWLFHTGHKSLIDVRTIGRM
jgi:hypothetical protein